MSIAFVHLQSDSVPERGRLELLLFSFYLHQLSSPADHLTELDAYCEMLKGEGQGAPSILKIRSYGPLKKLVCSSKCRSRGLSESQQHSVRSQHVKACDWQFLFHERDVMKRQRERARAWEREMEAEAEVWKGLKAKQVSEGSSLWSYLTGDRNECVIGKVPWGNICGGRMQEWSF